MFNQKPMRKIFLAISLVVAVMAIGRINAAKAQQPVAGKVIADLGFRPDGNGFGFQNYGADTPVTNLTPVEMRRLLGDQACASISGNNCTLVPQIKELMDTLNGQMAGGHCEGMAVLSSLFFAKIANPADFGQTVATGLPFDNNTKLQSEIALWFSTQFLNSVGAANIKDKAPKDLLDLLTKSMTDKSDYYVIHIFQPGFKSGHAITPYELQDMGNGLFHVMVYDNNWPKDGNRFVEIDTIANTWTYLAATNPNVPEAVYKGDATTMTMHLSPILMRVTKARCSFCQLGTSAASIASSSFTNGTNLLKQIEAQYNQLTLYSNSDTNAADLLITDAQGHRLGYQTGKFYSEIPDASYIPATSADLFSDNPEPVYFVPVGVAFTVTLDGTMLQKAEVTNVSMVGPTYDLAVENIKLQAGKMDTIDFAADGTKLSYTPSAEEAPDVIVGVQHSGNDYEFALNGADLQPGATINVSLDYDKGRLGINTTGSGEKATTYAVSVDRITDTTTDSFSHDGLPIDPNATAYIEFGAWDGKGDMTVTIDKNSDGASVSSQPEPNQHK